MHLLGLSKSTHGEPVSNCFFSLPIRFFITITIIMSKMVITITARRGPRTTHQVTQRLLLRNRKDAQLKDVTTLIMNQNV